MERMNDTALRKEARRNRYFMDQIRIKELVATNAIEREMRETYGFREFCMHCVLRHRNHDWGDLCDEDWKQNDWAVEHEERLLSAYDIPKALCIGYESKIWIITEADGSVTTILFPSDY